MSATAGSRSVSPMQPATLAHFAINSDDVERSKTFYEKVFGWKVSAWGPPGFYLIHTGDESDPGIQGLMRLKLPLLRI